MNVTLLLADSAQVAGDKLYILGGGWSFIGPQVGPMAIAGLVQVPWDEANKPHHWTLELRDEDGSVVVLPDNQQLRVEGDLEVGRPPGHPHGTPFNVPLALNFGPLMLEPGRRFVWVFSLDGKTDEGWQVAFNVRSA